MISKVIIFFHVVFVGVVLYLTIKVLRDEDNEKQGIVQILLRDQEKRFVPVPDIVDSVGAVATVIKSAASSLATSAIAAGESLITESLPSSISIGTKFACIGSECTAIPGSGFQLGESLAVFVPSAEKIRELEGFVNKSPNFETILSVGLGLVLISAISLLASLKFRPLRFAALGLNIVATVLYLTLTVFTVLICEASRTVGDLLKARTERGDVFETSIGNLVVGVCMCGMTLAYMFF
ncbi:uncharacterized protein CTRU02_215489 [Colletotrichum truncatum]|uniref:Uncharacterized protein n=1 Tax=Colletotrichum truncatum TaxID=5467 RepID=A0ACC3YCN8_COLTU|nr:uncharacterized protein CTRU02_05567 [Colletotrichum truncatum]KAF6794010.1 hypothetical protein CTRU02_05567 [Colletotrichum truncatum]